MTEPEDTGLPNGQAVKINSNLTYAMTERSPDEGAID